MSEAILEPELPIIDPHHHFWDTPHRGLYLLPELLSDIGGGHNVVSTVFLECRAMYRKGGPRHMAALGEVEFVAGLAAMSASGNYGPCRVAEVIIGKQRNGPIDTIKLTFLGQYTKFENFTSGSM